MPAEWNQRTPLAKSFAQSKSPGLSSAPAWANGEAANVPSLLVRDGREAAVHDDVLPGDKRRGARGGQPDDGAGEFFRVAEAGHRRVADDLLAALGVTAVGLEQHRPV